MPSGMERQKCYIFNTKMAVKVTIGHKQGWYKYFHFAFENFRIFVLILQTTQCFIFSKYFTPSLFKGYSYDTVVTYVQLQLFLVDK